MRLVLLWESAKRDDLALSNDMQTPDPFQWFRGVKKTNEAGCDRSLPRRTRPARYMF